MHPVCLSFYTQMVSLYKDPGGKHVFDTNKRKSVHDTSTIGTSTIGTTSTLVSRREQKNPKVQQLESEIVALEKTLRDYQVS